jgi:hypothetical protein
MCSGECDIGGATNLLQGVDAEVAEAGLDDHAATMRPSWGPAPIPPAIELNKRPPTASTVLRYCRLRASSVARILNDFRHEGRDNVWQVVTQDVVGKQTFVHVRLWTFLSFPILPSQYLAFKLPFNTV